jgi:hypothetical protein
LDVCDSYRPEVYYMRGPGPKWRAKHQPWLRFDSEAVPPGGQHELSPACAPSRLDRAIAGQGYRIMFRIRVCLVAVSLSARIFGLARETIVGARNDETPCKVTKSR